MLPKDREINPWLDKRRFVKHFKPCLTKMDKEALHLARATGASGGVQSCAPVCHRLLCRDLKASVCEDVFDEICGKDDYVSLDEIEQFILFFSEDDGDSSDHESDEEEEDEEVLHAMNDEDTLAWVAHHGHFHEELAGEVIVPTQQYHGLNALADMVLGGPAKVTASWAKIAAAAGLQSILVCVPLVFPAAMVWFRAGGAPETDAVYVSERMPIFGTTEHLQDFTFSIGAAIIGLGMLENALYATVGRELLRTEDAQRKRLIDCCFFGSAFVNRAFKVLYALALVVMLAQLVQLVILLVLALTVDPYRTMAAILCIITVVWYIKHSLRTLRSVQKKLKEQITTNYITREQKRLEEEAAAAKVANAELATENVGLKGAGVEAVQRDALQKDAKLAANAAVAAKPADVTTPMTPKEIAAAAKKAGLSKSSLAKLEDLIDDELQVPVKPLGCGVWIIAERVFLFAESGLGSRPGRWCAGSA